MKKLILFASFFATTLASYGQRVVPLVEGLTVDSILVAVPGATKLALQSVSGHLYYSTIGGEIHEVYVPASGAASATLKYTATDHGIGAVQGLCIRDSVMYVCGNNWSSVTGILYLSRVSRRRRGPCWL